jgi:hypothetical protein
MSDELESPISSRLRDVSTARDTAISASLGDFRAATAPSSAVFVDVGSRKIESQIERDGVPIGVLAVNQDILRQQILVRPVLKVRVVKQSIEAGRPVPVGTSVDLETAFPGTLPVGVIDGVHTAFKDMQIAEAFTKLVADNPLVNRIVTNASAGQLSTEDKTAVHEIFAKANVDVTDTPGSDINAAVATLSMLKTFGG